MDSIEEKRIKSEIEFCKNYEFSFENLVFEGGGAKICSYSGAIKVLEEIGLLNKCKRFGGTSGGAIIATCLSMGMTSEQVYNAMNTPINELLKDAPTGCGTMCSIFRNVKKKFGWNPGAKFLKHTRQIIEDQTGNADITFNEMLKNFNKELCIVATNVTTMSVQYFHPKTTPDFPVAIAIMCSLAIPGYVQPVCHVSECGMPEYFCDGGLLCNFPLHCFDGWYLSMKKEDSFFLRLGDEEEPFGSFNPKTLGFIVFNAWEGDFKQESLVDKTKHFDLNRPDTLLSKKRGKACDEMKQEIQKRQDIFEAAKRFVKTLREISSDYNGRCRIPLEDFLKAMQQKKNMNEDIKILFGKNVNEVFEEIDLDSDGNLSLEEFVLFMESKGIRLRTMFDGGAEKRIHTLSEYLETAFNSLLNMTRKVYIKDRDSHRTAGVYTDYVDTMDFAVSEEDKNFLIRQAVIGTVVYLSDLARSFEEGRVPSIMKGSVRLKTAEEKKEAQRKPINVAEKRSSSIPSDRSEEDKVKFTVRRESKVRKFIRWYGNKGDNPIPSAVLISEQRVKKPHNNLNDMSVYSEWSGTDVNSISQGVSTMTDDNSTFNQQDKSSMSSSRPVPVFSESGRTLRRFSNRL